MSLIDKFDKNVMLTEARIIPQIQSSVYYRIFTSHLNNILKQHLLLKKKKEIYRVMYVTKWYKQSPWPRYWTHQLCWVSRTSTKQEEEKFQIVYLKWCICLFTNMELYFQLKHVSSNFETRYKCTYMYAKHIYMYNCTWRWPNLFEHLNLVNADGNQCFTGLLLP